MVAIRHIESWTYYFHAKLNHWKLAKFFYKHLLDYDIMGFWPKNSISINRYMDNFDKIKQISLFGSQYSTYFSESFWTTAFSCALS